MKSIGILGGTFNPIHNGHIMLAKAAFDEYSLDRVLIMPSGESYMKAGTGVLPGVERYAMVRIAVDGIEGLVPDDREIKRYGNTYTCDTLCELEEEYGAGVKKYFIIGADNLRSIHTWKNVSDIFRMAYILAAVRNEDGTKELSEYAGVLSNEYGARISFLHSPRFDVSSSMIREGIKTGMDVSSYLPEGVYEYIMKRGLYGEE